MLLFASVIIFCAFALLWSYARWNHGTLEEMQIPVVPFTNPILGHVQQFYEKIGPFLDIEWMEKYGPVFGVYEGREPQVFICDPELIRLICVKDFDYFVNNKTMEMGDPVASQFPIFLRDEKWRFIRSKLSPAFTSAKLKSMNSAMKEATLDYIKGIKSKIKENGGKLEKLAIDQSIFTMLGDLILRSIYSTKFDGTGNEEFANLIKDMFAPPSWISLPKQFIYYSHSFPILRRFLPSLIFKPGISSKFINFFKEMLQERENSTEEKFNDNFEMIIEILKELNTPEVEKLGISENTVIALALVFFAASQDQISMMLASVIYHMTEDPKLERKLTSEVDKVFSKNGGNIGHENLNEFKLLNSSILEATRLYPVSYRTGRTCTKDWESSEFNLKIKKGTVIVFPWWAINRNPKYLQNPEEFKAERFLPERMERLNVYASTSFGHGPRGCVGEKLALEIMTTLMAYLLKELKFMRRNDTKLEFTPGGLIFTQHEPIYIDVMER